MYAHVHCALKLAPRLLSAQNFSLNLLPGVEQDYFLLFWPGMKRAEKKIDWPGVTTARTD